MGQALAFCKTGQLRREAQGLGVSNNLMIAKSLRARGAGALSEAWNLTDSEIEAP
jgi:hypothetical protein